MQVVTDHRAITPAETLGVRAKDSALGGQSRYLT